MKTRRLMQLRLVPLFFVALAVATVTVTLVATNDGLLEVAVAPVAETVEASSDTVEVPTDATGSVNRSVDVSPVPPAPRTPEPTLEPSEFVTSTTRPHTPARSEPSAVMPAATPLRLQIPSIGVDADLVELGLQSDGTMEVPSGGFPAGWYGGAPTPGELGPAVIAGHVDWAGKPGVFFELRDLEPGDRIAVLREDGSTAHFRVTGVERFAKAAFPTQTVYGDIDHAGLRLITCGGAFDRQARSYTDNLVVFAELVPS